MCYYYLMNKRNIRLRIKKAFALSISLFLLCACSLPGLETEEVLSPEDEITTLGLDPEFDYAVPTSVPCILVDQLGYALDSSKIAIIRGEAVPEYFEIINESTKESVYRGTVEEKGYDTVSGEYISYADFSDFGSTGMFYLQAPIVGHSYSFSITIDPYDELFASSIKQYYLNRCGIALSEELAGTHSHSACHTKSGVLGSNATVKLDVTGGWHIDENGNRDVVKGCSTINTLLLSYEIYPDVYSDNIGIPESGNGIPDILDEVKYETDWLLKMQDSVTGAIYSSVSCVSTFGNSYTLSITDPTTTAALSFATTMAKFSYLYQAYDVEYATTCLKAADRAYRYAEQSSSALPEEQYFCAGCELYRATGSRQYHDKITSYMNPLETIDVDNDYVFWGCVTYLSTTHPVDVNLCGRLMKQLMKSASDISLASKSSKYLTECTGSASDNDELLHNMARLSVVDHVITNHEYVTVLENHVHYFLGRNSMAVSFFDNIGSYNYTSVDKKTGITSQIDLNAELLLLLSGILAES